MNRKLYPLVVAMVLAGCAGAGWEGGSMPVAQAEAKCQKVAANSVPLVSAPDVVARGHSQAQVKEKCMKDQGFFWVE